MNTTSPSLLEDVRKGPSTLAWQRWHSIYEPLIHSWLRRHNLIPADRDDLVQNVLVVVVRRLGEFQHNGNVGAFRKWLKTITILCLRDFWKKEQGEKAAAASSLLDDWASDRGELSQAWDLEHDRHLLQKLLAMLKPDFAPETWAAFEGLVIRGEDAEAVAKGLGISRNAVYIAKSRVLTRLRQEAAGLVDDDSMM